MLINGMFILNTNGFYSF